MTIKYLSLASGDPLPEIVLGYFRSVVLIESEVDKDWQYTVSRWLVYSGCRYMMAWGRDCSSWDDSVDLANMEEFNDGDVSDPDFVYTTWHERESVEDVFFFARCCANHDSHELRNLLILDIGKSGREQELLEKYLKA